MTANNRSISIIGAGIGGLTVALTLRKAGFQSHIFERAQFIEALGAGIILAGNAMQVMRDLGLSERLAEKGYPLDRMKIVDAKLQPLSMVNLEKVRQVFGVGSLAIHRADLQEALIEEAGMEHISLGKELIKADTGDVFTLTFADSSRLMTSTLIGADGIRSAVREQLIASPLIRRAGQVCWRGIEEFDLPARFNRELNEIWGKGKRLGFVRVNSRQVYWYALANSEMSKRKDFDLKTMFRDCHRDVQPLLERIDISRSIKGEVMDIKPMNTWTRGAACLLGDAAHATTPNMGQGACQAIEDAYVLAKCLEKYEASEALERYVSLRVKKANRVTDDSWMMGKISQLNSNAGIYFRNKLMRMTPNRIGEKRMMRLCALNYNL